MAFEPALTSTRHRGAVLGIAVAVAALMTAAQTSCEDRATTTESDSSSLKASSGARVTYAVTADGQIASVSYTNGDGDIDTDTGVGTGWTGSARMPNLVAPVELTAVAGSGTSVVRCSIAVGGNVVQQAKAVGSSPTVTCAGSVSASND
jgi:Mycobacterium membrane protein